MTTYPNATLGGFPLLGSRPIQWSLIEGVRPYEESFDLSPADARALQARGNKPVSLVINVNGIRREITNLWVLNVMGGDNPQIMRAKVSDRRWMLPYFHFLRRFNMRRNVGYKRVGDNAQPILNQVVADVWYWKWSLKDPNGKAPTAKWQPSDVLDNVLNAIAEEERKSGPSPGYVISQDIKKTDRKLSVENFSLDDSGEACLMRALALIPEAGVYVNDAGQYVIYSKINGGEAAKLKALGPEIIGGGHATIVTNELTCPREVEVRFSMEIEVRHDYIETSTSDAVGTDKRQMRNVLVVPDWEVTIDGDTAVQGTYADFDKVLACPQWASPPGIGGQQVTQAVLQKAALPYVDLWAALQLTGLRSPDQDWAARVGALQQHWRRTFQLAPAWVERSLQIKGYRVGLVDVVTGTNGPAQAFCDHSFIGTQRSMFKQVIGKQTLEPFINIDGYPEGGQVPGVTAPDGALSLTPTSKAAPAIVSVWDSDQGIVHVDFQSDKNHMFEAALPGQIVRDDGQPYGPTLDGSNPRRAPIAFDIVCSRGQVPKLSADYKLAMILTHVPASPNDERQLYSVVMKPEDVKELLPPSANTAIKKAKGPRWVVRVRAGNDSARALVRWSDARAVDIEKLFGVDGPPTKGVKPTPPNLEGLILNAAPQNAIDNQQAASLTEIARAIAASVFARFTDRFEGNATGHLHSTLTLDGWMQQLTLQLSQKGEGTLSIGLADQIQPRDYRSLLDSGTRAILDRIPHPER